MKSQMQNSVHATRFSPVANAFAPPIAFAFGEASLLLRAGDMLDGARSLDELATALDYNLRVWRIIRAGAKRGVFRLSAEAKNALTRSADHVIGRLSREKRQRLNDEVIHSIVAIDRRCAGICSADGDVNGPAGSAGSIP